MNAPQLLNCPCDTATVQQCVQEWSRFLQVPTESQNSLGATMCLIPPGDYWRGTSNEARLALYKWQRKGLEKPFNVFEEYSFTDEMPRHRVRLTQPFWMGNCAITIRQYHNLTGRWGSDFVAGQRRHFLAERRITDDWPADLVTWFSAVEFCNQLSELEGLPPYYRFENLFRDSQTGEIAETEVEILGGNSYRLPTEAEWEYACRAGTDTYWYFGDQPLPNREHNALAALKDGDENAFHKTPTKVCSYKPNPFALYDLHGNSQTWCFDEFQEYDPQWASDEAVIDPIVIPGSPYTERIYRGGGNASSVNSRSAFRWSTNALGAAGIRLARDISMPS